MIPELELVVNPPAVVLPSGASTPVATVQLPDQLDGFVVVLSVA